jgi:hypothetical protein
MFCNEVNAELTVEFSNNFDNLSGSATSESTTVSRQWYRNTNLKAYSICAHWCTITWAFLEFGPLPNRTYDAWIYFLTHVTQCETICHWYTSNIDICDIAKCDIAKCDILNGYSYDFANLTIYVWDIAIFGSNNILCKIVLVFVSVWECVSQVALEAKKTNLATFAAYVFIDSGCTHRNVNADICPPTFRNICWRRRWLPFLLQAMFPYSKNAITSSKYGFFSCFGPNTWNIDMSYPRSDSPLLKMHSYLRSPSLCSCIESDLKLFGVGWAIVVKTSL